MGASCLSHPCRGLIDRAHRPAQDRYRALTSPSNRPLSLRLVNLIYIVLPVGRLPPLAVLCDHFLQIRVVEM